MNITETIEALKQQLDVLEQIQKKGFNIVKCCHCEKIILFDNKQTEVMCVNCLKNVSSENCNDIFY